MIFLVIAGLLMAILAVLFAFQNAEIVTIDFGSWQFEQSLAIILIITLGIGIIISLLLSVPTILKRGWQNSNLQKKNVQLEAQIKSQAQSYQEIKQENLAKQDGIQQLLEAFNLADTVTGLLTKEATVEMTKYFLQQMQAQGRNSRYTSLTAMLLSVAPDKSKVKFADLGSTNAVYKAIATRFNKIIIPDSFLGITDRKRFISLTLGLTGTEVADYATYLRDKIIEFPLQKADGTTLPIKVNIGGVIVDPTDMVDSRSILQQAEQNLDLSLEKGRNNLEITEITPKTS